MRHGTLLTAALTAVLALALVNCGEDEPKDDPIVKTDGGIPPKPDAGEQNDNQNPDAGSKPDKPTLESVEATIAQIRTNTDAYSDVTDFPAKPKKIVTVKGAVVVGSYAHSSGDATIYIQDPAGGPNSGIQVYLEKQGKTNAVAPEVGTKVDVTGCIGTSWGVLRFMWCGDVNNTQATMIEVGTAAVPEPPEFEASTLAHDGTDHDDYLGAPIKIPGVMYVDSATAPECQGTDGKYYCVKLKDSNGDIVYMRTVFTHRCSNVTTGPFADLVGAWDWYSAADKSLYRTIAPFTCDALVTPQ
jgi:hypothetical protein